MQSLVFHTWVQCKEQEENLVWYLAGSERRNRGVSS